MPALLGKDDRPLPFVAAVAVCAAAEAHLSASVSGPLFAAASLERLRDAVRDYRATIETNARYSSSKPKRTKTRRR